MYIFFFLINNQITTGAPNNEVIAFIGKVYSKVGNWAILSQINNTIAPVIAVAGINILWLEVVKINLAICGTANPIKAIGPEKAVMTPVSKLVIIKMIILLCLIFIPKLLAYFSPNNKLFKGLIMAKTPINPIKYMLIKTVSSSQDKFPKLPKLQNTYCWICCASLK